MIVEACRREVNLMCRDIEPVVGDLVDVCFAFPRGLSDGLWAYSFLCGADWSDVGAVVAANGKRGDLVQSCCCARVFRSELTIIMMRDHPKKAELWWDDEILGSIVKAEGPSRSHRWMVYMGDQLFGAVAAEWRMGAVFHLRTVIGELMMIRVSRKASIVDLLVPIGNLLSFAWVVGRRLFEPVGDFVIPQRLTTDIDDDRKKLYFAVQVAFRCVYFRGELERMS